MGCVHPTIVAEPCLLSVLLAARDSFTYCELEFFPLLLRDVCRAIKGLQLCRVSKMSTFSPFVRMVVSLNCRVLSLCCSLRSFVFYMGPLDKDVCPRPSPGAAIAQACRMLSLPCSVSEMDTPDVCRAANTLNSRALSLHCTVWLLGLRVYWCVVFLPPPQDRSHFGMVQVPTGTSWGMRQT